MRILRETAAAAAAAYLRGRARKANSQEERKHRVTPTIPFQKLLDSFPEKIHKREEKHFLSDSEFYSAIASLVLEPEVAARRSQKGRKEAEEGARKEGEEVCRSRSRFSVLFLLPFSSSPMGNSSFDAQKEAAPSQRQQEGDFQPVFCHLSCAFLCPCSTISCKKNLQWRSSLSSST